MNIVEALKISTRIRHEAWQNWHIELDEKLDRFIISHGNHYLLTPSYMISEKWEPYIDPCKHEPSLFRMNYDFKKNDWNMVQGFECHHCGVKLQATGWEEVK